MVVHQVTDYAACIGALKQAGLRQSLYDVAAVLMDRVVVNLHGDEHKVRRNEEARIFRKDIFLTYEKSVLPGTLAETIAPYKASGGADLVDLGYRVMMNLTVDFTGIDRLERSAEETGELLALMKTFSLAPSMGQSRLEDVAPLLAQLAAAMARFDAAYFTPSYNRRLALVAAVRDGTLTDAELPRDVLTTLIAGQDRVSMSREELLKETIFFVLAGAHTSIHSLTHAFHEIGQWLRVHPEDRDRIEDDPYFIQRCVFESLRLHPSSPVARRRALCPVDLGVACAAADDEVIVDLRAANRDKALFGADADCFNPHRFVGSGQFPYGLSLGHGMHACLGRNLAIGVVPRPGGDPSMHQYGIVPLIVAALFADGVAPDPNAAPSRDETITRVTWAHYPVVFGK
jgi:cytochrome P450